MNELNNFNKVTGVHYIKKPIEDINIKIILKPHEKLISLPKFDEFDSSNNIQIDPFQSKIEEYQYKWQEKVFNSQELEYYSDKNNCTTENEIYYHELIKKNDSNFGHIFTYVNEDGFMPVPFNNDISNTRNNVIDKLTSYLKNWSINDKVGNLMRSNAESSQHLFRSDENISIEHNQWMSMHIMMNNSKYNDDLQLMVKQEAILISLYWNKANSCLILKPDVNKLNWNPYTLESITGERWNYQYAVEIDHNDSDLANSKEEFKVMLQKLQRKWDSKHKDLLTFVMPPVGVKVHHFTLEILTANDFNLDNLYIEFNIKVPDSVTCDHPLHGRTHTSRCGKSEDNSYWSFGHVMEFQFDCAVDSDTPVINVFLEVISQDWWGRHRTEGYAHMAITLNPSRGSRVVSTIRPEERDQVEAESRRFFLGGCNLLKDLEVLALPQEHSNPNIRYVGSGNVSVRWQTICQSALVSSTTRHKGSCSASALLLGADAVLRQYKRARARLAAATKDLDIGDHVGFVTQ